MAVDEQRHQRDHQASRPHGGGAHPPKKHKPPHQGHDGGGGHHGGQGHNHGHGGHDHHQQHHAKGQRHGHGAGGGRRQRRHPHAHGIADDFGHDHAPADVPAAFTGEERDPATYAADPVADAPWTPEPPQHRPERRGILDAFTTHAKPEPVHFPSVPELLSDSGPEAHPYNDPQHVTFRGSAVGITGTNLIIGLPNGPNVGRIWHVRSLRAVGGTPVTNAGDSAVFHFFVGPDPGSPADGDIADLWRDYTVGVTLPAQATYGRHEFVVRYPNLVYVLVTGGTAGRVYTFTGSADDEIALVPRGSREVVEW